MDFNYAFYRENYGGKLLNFENFTALAGRARSYVHQITLGRARGLSAEEGPAGDAVRRAMCAVAETLFAEGNGGGEIASETVGRHTVHYRQDTPAPGGRLLRAASCYLAEPGLLYRGF